MLEDAGDDGSLGVVNDDRLAEPPHSLQNGREVAGAGGGERRP